MENIILAQILSSLTGLSANHKGQAGNPAITAAENGALISHYTKNDVFRELLDGFIHAAVSFIERDDAPGDAPPTIYHYDAPTPVEVATSPEAAPATTPELLAEAEPQPEPSLEAPALVDV